MNEISIYLHIPFCKHRCGYCDFNTYSGIENLIPQYVDALINEIKSFASQSKIKHNVHTIFFGGGTPSLLEIPQIEKILNTIGTYFNLSGNPEISLEANPGTVDQKYLSDLFSIDVNRLSLGLQSANPAELKILERLHGYEDAALAVDHARKAGFINISLDLIFGIPNQSISDWKNNLIKAIELNPEHISLYSLTIEEGTPIEKQINNGLLIKPDDDLAADMYEWTMEFLAERDFVHYEISNWAKKDEEGFSYQAKHNLQYWHNRNYIGFGAGAHSFMGGHRFSNILSPKRYIQKINENQLANIPFSASMVENHEVDKKLEMQETLMMGLRLLQEGVSKKTFNKNFNLELESVFSNEINELIKNGLLEWGGETKDNLILTKRGCLLGNQVFLKFVE